jgi:hypothetical protein
MAANFPCPGRLYDIVPMFRPFLRGASDLRAQDHQFFGFLSLIDQPPAFEHRAARPQNGPERDRPTRDNFHDHASFLEHHLTELARLRRQVSEQEKDIAFLKKASAYFAANQQK